jgi:hypothetical protein
MAADAARSALASVARGFPARLVASAALVLLAVCWIATDRPIEWRAGVLVDSEPEQTDVEAPLLERVGFRVLPRAAFRAEVRVLARERYRLDALAEVAPLDIAVGWGPLSDTAVLNELRISQSGRFFHWRAKELPLPLNVIETHLANWHLVPANDSVWRQLQRIRVGDVVTLEGLLVDLDSAETGLRSTSLTRADSGAGACEIVWVETVGFRYR